MAKTTTVKMKRIEIPYFDGVNSLVGQNISKKQELTHVENARSVTIGSIEKRQGKRRLGNEITSTANYGIFFFENSGNNGFYRVSTVSATTSVYYLSNVGAWTILGGGGTGLSGAQTDFTFAEGNCFIVNGTDVNRYISSDGVTVVTAATATGHLYESPKANKINFYLNRLYVADYYVGATRYKTGIQFSSKPVGLVSLVDGDHTSGVTSVEVTDTKYIYASDTLQVYRGGTLITSLTVTGKTETTLTVNATGADLESSDELWVNGTYTGQRVFRWASNAPSGEDVSEYDTFELSGGQNDRIKMLANIGNIMMIGNSSNLSAWDGASQQNFDLGIGCVSDNGYVKSMGSLWFLDYTGIYSTTGDTPKLISSKVEKYIQGATKEGLEAAAAGKKGLSIFFAIGDVTLYNPDGSINKTLEDVVLEYNIRQQNWYVHTGIDASQFATYIHSSDPDRLEFQSTTAPMHIYEFLNSEEDAEVEIPFRIDSDNITLAPNFENICYPQQIAIETERGSGMQCFVSLDNGPFYQIKGEIIKGCTVLKVNNKDLERASPPRCRQIKLSIRDFSTKLCKISRVAILYTSTLEQEEQRINQE